MIVVADSPSKTPVTITLAEPGEDIELKSIAYIVSILDRLNGTQQIRVIEYLRKRFIAGAVS